MTRRFSPGFALLLALWLSAPVQAQSTGKAALRFRCEGDNVGAAVHINGQFKGECPFDVSVPEGTLKIRAVQQMGQEYERVFEQDVRVAADSVKVVEVDMGPKRLTADGQRIQDARLRREAEALQAERAAQFERQRAAAKNGDAQAMAILAEAYEKGQNGLPNDSAQALAWYTKAAEAGNAEAMYRLIDKDASRANVWLRKAAQAGHSRAQEQLAQLPRFCRAVAMKDGLFTGAYVVSPGFDDIHADGTYEPIKAALVRYAAQLRRLQPGVWDEAASDPEMRCYRASSEFLGKGMTCRQGPHGLVIEVECGPTGEAHFRNQVERARNGGKIGIATMLFEWRGE